MTEPQQPVASDDPVARRPPYRPPIGLPTRGDGRWGAPFAIAIHLLMAMIMLWPLLLGAVRPDVSNLGAGGPGPAGGGGGGMLGTGGPKEKLRFIRVAPAPPPAPEVKSPAEVPPLPPPTPPEPQPVATPEPEPITEPQQAATEGSGGGTGRDGTSGTGPGSGGGTGSGIGTGTGSAVGPGTGGGDGTIYPPTPDFLVIAPNPIPSKVHGRTMVLLFSISERGEILKIELAQSSGDRKYDKRVLEEFREYRFRPAVRADGSPVSAIARLEVQL